MIMEFIDHLISWLLPFGNTSYLCIVPVLFHSLFHFISFFFYSQSCLPCPLLCFFRIIFVCIAIWLLYLSTSFLSFSSSCFNSHCLKKSSLSSGISPVHFCFIEVINCLVFFIHNNMPLLVTIFFCFVTIFFWWAFLICHKFSLFS